MTDQLGFVILRGTGIFSSGDCQVESRFILQRQFSHTVFLTQEEEAARTFIARFNGLDSWSLSGKLEDGRIVSANQLMVAKIGGSEEFTELVPLTSVVLGQANLSSLLKVQYRLVGMFDGKFLIEDSGWTIEILDSDQNTTIAESHSKAWRIPLEGLTLRLSCKQKTLEEYHEKAREIMTLLSLALGNGVTSYRYIVSSESQDSMEVWRQMTGDEIGPGPIIPTHRLGQFLNQVLPVWNKWKSEKKSEVRLAITYINLSATGYLDTRLLQISQAWEFLAASWIPQGKLNDQESDLRARIKASYREWKKEYPEADPKGIWGGRVTFPFKWPLAKRQMESLADRKGIDFSKIGFDLEVLKEARDSVVHTGKMITQVNLDGNDTYHVLAAAQFGLRLILISELGYFGSIVASSEGWRTFVPIAKYVKKLEL